MFLCITVSFGEVHSYLSVFYSNFKKVPQANTAPAAGPRSAFPTRSPYRETEPDIPFSENTRFCPLHLLFMNSSQQNHSMNSAFLFTSPCPVRTNFISIRCSRVCKHCALRLLHTFTEVVPLSVDQMPASVHMSLTSVSLIMQVIPDSIVFDPTGLHVAVLIEVIPLLFSIPADQFPGRLRIASVLRLKPPAFFIPLPESFQCEG